MSTSQLTLYKGAERFAGQRTIATLSDTANENLETLNEIWDENARDHCLSLGLWNFATRTQQIEYNSSIDPDFGFQRAFTKPSDWIRTNTIASDEYFTAPMTDPEYVDEQSYWFADIDTIYVRYISNDASYGYDLSLWPPTFVKFVESYLGYMLAERITADLQTLESLEKKMGDRLVMARSNDAMNEGVKFRPQGRWVRARRGGGGSRGSRSRLIG